MARVAASQVVTPAGVVGPADVVIEGDRVAAVEPRTGPAPNRTLVPGFVDLQINGIDDVAVATASGADWDRLDQLLLAQGTTTWCPTLITAPLDAYTPALERMAWAAGRGDERPRPCIAGAHLEGPFLGGAPGAHDPALIVPPDLAWLDALPPIVRVVTLAPEAGAAVAVEALRARGILVALGHSAAAYEHAVAAIDAGAGLVTHLYNGMAPLHHRSPGLVGAALTDDRVAVSVIADNVHVHPAAVLLAFRAKGAGGVVLVTDAVAWRSPWARHVGVDLVEGAARLPDGTLAGTALTMDAAIRNAVAAGVDLVTAVRAASTTPARLLGLTDRGAIAPGCRADLVALSPALEVENVWIGGAALGAPG